MAPPDRHLLLEKNRLRVVFGPRENRVRPAIDPLFRTAAQALGPRVVGVIMSGTLDDGCNGLIEIKRHGGLAVVQDPADAEFAQLPENAIKAVRPDRIASVAALPAILEM